MIYVKSNIIYFNCACTTLICLNKTKQNITVAKIPLLRELGHDQFSPLQVLRPRIQIRYKSLFGLMMLLQLCIALLNSPNKVYSRNLSSQYFVCPQNLLFERHVASRPDLHVSPIFPSIFCLMIQSCILQLVDWYSRDICCYDTSICNSCGHRAS
jgi:hypothetical protein